MCRAIMIGAVILGCLGPCWQSLGAEPAGRAQGGFSDDAVFIPYRSPRAPFQLLYGEDVFKAAAQLLAFGKSVHPLVVPHVVFFLEDERPADRIREGLRMKHAAAWALDSFYCFPEGRYDYRTFDLKRLDERAAYWQEWSQKKLPAAFGKEAVREEILGGAAVDD